jgi:hypothetical protein
VCSLALLVGAFGAGAHGPALSDQRSAEARARRELVWYFMPRMKGTGMVGMVAS